MKKNYYIIYFFLLISKLSFGQISTLFISEIHYDNIWSDKNEGVEVTGTPGYDLSGWQIILYDGEKGKMYKTVKLSEELPENGVLWTSIKNIQNGSYKKATKTKPAVVYPDGVALVNTNVTPTEVVEFISYEGTFTAEDGPAEGLKSTNIFVFEFGVESSGKSLQKTDAGWVGPTTASAGEANSNLTLDVEENIMKELKMYPNPVANGLIYISFYNSYEKQISIYSTLGKQVYSNILKSNQPIDVSNFSTGVYLVRIEEDAKVVTKKLVIR